MCLEGLQYGASRFVGVGAIGKATVLPESEYVAKVMADFPRHHVEGTKTFDSGNVDQASPTGEIE